MSVTPDLGPDPRPARPLSTELADYGLIGNLHTAALVSRFGTIDWACFPRFAAPSTFARILDPAVGGFHEIAPVGPFRSSQRYELSTNILVTRFLLSGDRSLTVSDFMPVQPDAPGEGTPMVVRRLAARGGPVQVRVTFAPKFRYGAVRPQWEPVDGGAVAASGPDALLCTAPWAGRPRGAAWVAAGSLRPGAGRTVELVWGRVRPTRATASSLHETERKFWKGWVHSREAPLHAVAGRWHYWIERSELVLKLLSHRDTGAFVAAPTTSLPEWPNGHRNWDYRYAWVRDAAFAAESLFLLGHHREPAAFLEWAMTRLGPPSDRKPLRVVYGAHGETDLTERTIDRFRGFLNARPVRVGNGAARQFQLDIYGELLDAAYLIGHHDPALVERHAEQFAFLADEVVRLWKRPDHGIWEIRGPPRQYVHSKLMAWVCLDRADRLAGPFRDTLRARRWREEAEAIRAWLLSHGFDRHRGTFLQAAGRPAADAANLRVLLTGFLPASDFRVLGTVEFVRRELAEGPFVYRYRGGDGIAGPEGAFLPASFWLVECLARIGERQAALENWAELLRVGGPLALFSEEFDPTTRRPLGNYPQAFSHIAALRAAFALGVSLTP